MDCALRTDAHDVRRRRPADAVADRPPGTPDISTRSRRVAASPRSRARLLIVRILVDLQALQTAQSRHRGIGRYSLALFRAMARRSGDDTISALFNSTFADELIEAKQWIADLVPPERIHVFDTPGRTATIDADNAARGRAAAALLRLKVDTIAPDFVHVASLFESITDDSVTTIVPDGRWGLTLFDLIPWYRRDVYLENRDVRRAYMSKLDLARHASLVFAISDSARREAIETLSLSPDRVFDIRGDVDPLFSKGVVTEGRETALRSQLGLSRPFVMYTAGIDHRKNIEGLIEAYARLPGTLRAHHQLAIVCKAEANERVRLMQVAKRAGLADDELVCTGYVSDPDLADLYRLCKLFVFPSFHEGFGMPILEAMRCGAPAIGSNCSSMPELLGAEDAQFDPHSVEAIAKAVERPLRDEDARRMLIRNAARQQALFSWDDSARRVLDAFAAQHARRIEAGQVRVHAATPRARPTLAYVSPFPPEQSGIADYSSELVPALSRHYDITLVTDLRSIDHPWLDGVYPLCDTYRFERNGSSFDRVLYQLGNSAAFHADTLRLMRQQPGVVVLHDFFLSNLFDHLDHHGSKPGILIEEMFRSHGYRPLLELARRSVSPLEREAVVWRYPASRVAFEHSYGTIVHSNYSYEAARTHYGVRSADQIVRIEHIRNLPVRHSRDDARSSLGIASGQVVVCSFGLIGRTKLNLELARAWATSPLAKRRDHLLMFLGPTSDGPYDTALRQYIASAGLDEQIRLTGFVDGPTFERYLDAADCAVQLRADSRGETSGAVLHCLAHGLPVIVNRHGTLAELPDDAVVKIADRFSDTELASAMVELLDDPLERMRRGEAGRQFVHRECNAPLIAGRYFDAIEHFYERNPQRRLDGFVTRLVGSPENRLDRDEIHRVVAIAAGHVPSERPRQGLLDITGLVPTAGAEDVHPGLATLLRALIADEPGSLRFEPVVKQGAFYCYARSEVARLLDLDGFRAENDVVDFQDGDTMIVLKATDALDPQALRQLHELEARGVCVHAIDGPPSDLVRARIATAIQAMAEAGPTHVDDRSALLHERPMRGDAICAPMEGSLAHDDANRLVSRIGDRLVPGRYVLDVAGRLTIGDASRATIGIASLDTRLASWSAPLRSAVNPRFSFALSTPVLRATVVIELDADDVGDVTAYRIQRVDERELVAA